MKQRIFTFCLLIIITASCRKDKDKLSSFDYLIFGHFYGECFGEQCIEIFKLEQNQLLEDTTDIYPNSTSFYNGKYKLLSQQKFDSARDLVNFFPAELLTEPDTVIGQPDAGDWGGLYIEYSDNGKRKFWLLDQMKSNVPSKYHTFIDKVNEKIKLIQ
jgi:hypothetical protein